MPSAEAQIFYPMSLLNVGDEYSIGDVYEADEATIEIIDYRVDRTTIASPANTAAQHVRVVSSSIAGADGPELRINLAAVRVTPDEPVKYVSFRYGSTQSQSPDQLFNLGVNHQLLILERGLERADGKLLGRADHGRVLVRVTPDTPDSESGLVELIALTGHIEHWRAGGRPLYMDNVLMDSP